MKNGKVTLLAVATMAAVAITAQGVHANEIDQPNPAEHTELATGSTETGSAVGKTAQAGTEAEPTEAAVTESTLGDNEPSGGGKVNATSFEKNGSDIQVTNPEVAIDQANGDGKYSGFTVEYKNINFPDDMAIDEGDEVTFKLPEEITFQTSYEFDVKNPDNAVVGKASTDVASQTVTTVFNDYFKNHPINKQMSLILDAKWTDKVESGKPVTVNFNGTVKTVNIGEEGPLPSDELLSKWGSQDKNDPQVINWTLRLNTARQVLKNAVLKDTWSDNQEFIEDSQNIYFVEDPIKWSGIDHSAKDYLESWNVRADGFDAKFKEFNRILYIDYKTRLKAAVKESINPTNKAELTAENVTANSKSTAHLVGGRGDASGEDKPVFELPNDAPIVEIPEYNEPIGTVPNEAPKHDKPEFEGGVIPNEAPILYLPKLHIPESPEKPSKPRNDKPKENIKPKDKTPKVEREKVKITHEGERVEQYTAPATLPETGSDFGAAISLFGLSCLMVGSWLKKED